MRYEDTYFLILKENFQKKLQNIENLKTLVVSLNIGKRIFPNAFEDKTVQHLINYLIDDA